jgi:tetratricopeptide (TPR) repeat protein
MDPYQQALKAARARQFTVAERLCEQILAKDKKHVGALALLADVRQLSTDHGEAIKLLNRAVKIEPRQPELRQRLAENHAALGQYDQALVQVNQALKLRPGYVEASVTKAAALEHKGSYDKALAMLTPAMDRPDPVPGLVAVYLRILTRQGDAAEAIEVGRRALSGDLGEDTWVRDAWFALAKAHEVAGDHAGAMEAADRANTINAAPFDPEAHRRKVDGLIEVFTRGTLQAAPRPAAPSERPVFIVGMPRTGSTLVERILHAHPKVHGAGESIELPRVVTGLQLAIGSMTPYPACVRDLDLDDVETAAQRYLDAIAATAPRVGAERIVDKQLGNFIHVGMMDILFPGCRVIDCRRNAVDTCLSCYFERLQPWVVPYASRLDHLGAYYRQYERLMAHWHETVSVPLLEVSYEELIDDQEATSRRLVEFIGLEWDDACLKFHEVRRHEATLSYDQVRKPLYRASVGRAERFGALLDPLREALAGS